MLDTETRGAAEARGRRTQALIWFGVIAVIIVAGRVAPVEPVRDFFGSFGWLTKQTLRIAEDLFESYGYLVVFLAPLMENTLFIGALIPGTIIMILAGLGAHDGLISIWPAILLGIVGAMIGDTISYGMGRFGWQRLGPETRLVRWAERMREPLLNHSIWLIMTYHFAGYSRLVGPAAAGFLRMPFLRWMVIDYIGVALWATAFIGAGYLLGVFGLTLEDSDRNVHVFEAILFALFLVAVFTILNRAGKGTGPPAKEAADVDGASQPSDGLRPPAAPAPDPAEAPAEQEARERVT